MYGHMKVKIIDSEALTKD